MYRRCRRTAARVGCEGRRFGSLVLGFRCLFDLFGAGITNRAPSSCQVHFAFAVVDCLLILLSRPCFDISRFIVQALRIAILEFGIFQVYPPKYQFALFSKI